MRAGSEGAHAWGVRCAGGGALMRTEAGLRLLNLPVQPGIYTNAQIDDHATLPRREFSWHPPVRLTLRARFSDAVDALIGTAGFGFWNDPFAMNGCRWPALPHAAWFFLAAPPSNMAPAQGAPGQGWKAAVMNVAALPFWTLLPLAPPALPLMRVPAAYRALWPVAQRVLGADERLLTHDLTAWHTYALEWQSEGVRFKVNGTCVLESRTAPRGPLGLVIWMDNQYLIATPQGQFGCGVRPQAAAQWMEIADVVVE